MRRTHIMIHCLDTPQGAHFDRDDVMLWHTGPKSQGHRGWSNPGYAGIWLLDGELQVLKPFDGDEQVDPWEITNGAWGWNGVATHFAYVGGAGNVDTRTHGQSMAMYNTCRLLVSMWPDVKLIGHNQVNRHKYCPSFDVPKWAEQHDFEERNIDRTIYWKAT